MLSSVTKHKKAVMYIIKEIHVLEKLPSGVSSGATGCEFNVNVLTDIY